MYYGINNWAQLEEKGGKDGLIQDHGINNWAQLEEKGGKDGLIQDQAGSYFYLLKSVKAKDNKDNVWISFYEGQHRHAGQDRPVPVTNHRSRRYQDQTTTTENTLCCYKLRKDNWRHDDRHTSSKN